MDRKASQVFIVDDAPSDGDTIVWDATLRQWKPGAGGGGHPSTLYDATSGLPALVADNDVLQVQPDTDFHSHGNLDNAGANAGHGAFPTWYDPANAAWNDGSWFGFDYFGTGMGFFFGWQNDAVLQFFAGDTANYVQWGGVGEPWDFTELVLYGTSGGSTSNHIDMWASSAGGGYFALYTNGHGTPGFHFQTAGSDGSDADLKCGFFGVNLIGQAAHIAHATDNPSAITRLNNLIDAVQNYGLLAAA